MYTKIQNETQHEKTDSINLCNLNFHDLVLSCVKAVPLFRCIHCNCHLQDKLREIKSKEDAALCTGLCNGSMGGCVEHGAIHWEGTTWLKRKFCEYLLMGITLFWE